MKIIRALLICAAIAALPVPALSGGGTTIAIPENGDAIILPPGSALHFRAFGAEHAVAGVAVLADGAVLQRLPEAGPAGTRVILAGGAEQGLAAAAATVGAGTVFVPVDTGEGGLGALFAADAVFLGAERSPPFSIGLHGLVIAHGDSPDWRTLWGRTGGLQVMEPDLCAALQAGGEKSPGTSWQTPI